MTPREKTSILLLLLVIAFLIVWYLFLQNNLSGETYSYVVTLEKTKQIHDQNGNLAEELLRKESLTVIATESAQIGFIPLVDQNLLYLYR